MSSEPRRDSAFSSHAPGTAPRADPDAVVNDPARLAVVRATGLLDAPAEPPFDRLVRLAARLLGVPVTFVSLVDENRDFYLASTGFDEPLASGREMAGRTFCHFSVAGATPEHPLVIPDTRAHPVYREVPTVHSLGVAAYVGVPLVVDGQPVGSFCAIDTAPHAWTEAEVEVLRELAASAQREMELRRALDRARRTALEMERSHRERDEFLNATTDGIYTIDPDGRILFVNRAAAEQLGYEPGEIVGREGHALFHHTHADGTPYPREECAIWRAAAEGRTVQVHDEVLWRRDGTSFPVAYASSPVHRDGELVGAVVRFTDITGQKRALDGLHLLAESGRVLSSSLELDQTMQAIASLAVPALAEMAMVDLVEEGVVRRVAASHVDERVPALSERARHFPPRIGDPGPQSRVLRTGEPLLVRNVDEAWIRALDRGPEHAQLMREVAPDSLIVAPLRSRGAVLGTLTLIRTAARPCFDQADLELAEELGLRAALAVENARLYHSARHATRARDDMLGVVSHDLRNPIHSIFMSSSFLNELLPEGMKVERTQAAVIKRAAERANRLIQDLLDISHIESGQLSLQREPHSAASIAAEAVELSAMPAAERGIALVCGEMDRAARVMADRDRVVQALGNLIGNALKFTPEGGRVTVSVHGRDGRVHVAVADTGPGIAPEQLPRLFDRFWQANRKDRRGVGLGLSIVKGIADAHGGEVRVDTAEGAGTTFTLVLPAAPDEG
ncbi:MAG: GAF domain-containing protein [Gemmatimonadetes bacterium]|nr:GAF domain-containing protein [Gemmatimonadota bacterium]